MGLRNYRLLTEVDNSLPSVFSFLLYLFRLKLSLRLGLGLGLGLGYTHTHTSGMPRGDVMLRLRLRLPTAFETKASYPKLLHSHSQIGITNVYICTKVLYLNPWNQLYVPKLLYWHTWCVYLYQGTVPTLGHRQSVTDICVPQSCKQYTIYIYIYIY